MAVGRRRPSSTRFLRSRWTGPPRGSARGRGAPRHRAGTTTTALRVPPAAGTHAGQTFVAGTSCWKAISIASAASGAQDDRLRVVPEQPVHLAMDAPWVRAVFVGSSKEMELLVSIEADAEFWEPARLDADEDGRLPQGSAALALGPARAKKRGWAGTEDAGWRSRSFRPAL